MPLKFDNLQRWEEDPLVLATIGKEIEEKFYNENLFLKLAGRAKDRAVITHPLTKKVGEFRVRMKDNLKGDGIGGNTNYDTNRDQLEYYTNSFYSDRFGNSIESEDSAYEDAKGINFIREATNSLVSWADRKIHGCFAMTLINNPTNILVCDKANAVKSKTVTDKTTADMCKKVVTGDVVTVKAIQQMVKMAKTGLSWDGSVGFIIPPLKVTTKTQNGIEYTDKVYLILLSTTQCYQLKSDPEWKEMQKFASVRGETNALFTGAIGSIDGAVIVDAGDYVSPELIGLPSTKTSQSEFNRFVCADTPMGLSDYKKATDVSFGALLGAGALVFGANDTTDILVEKADMGTKMVVAIRKYLGLGKARWQKRSIVGNYIDTTDPLHNKDYGVIVIASSNE